MVVYVAESAARLGCSDRAFRRIAQAADPQAIFDDITAVRYGLAFGRLRFDVECEPCGDKGPDLAVSRDGETAFVEVRRFHPPATDIYEAAGSGGDALSGYGSP